MTFKFDSYINQYHNIFEQFAAAVEAANQEFIRKVDEDRYLPVVLFEERNEAADAAARAFASSATALHDEAVSHVADIKKRLLDAMSVSGDAAYYARLQIAITLIQSADVDHDLNDEFLHELTGEFSGDYRQMLQIHNLVERLCKNYSTRNGEKGVPIRSPFSGKHRFPQTFAQLYLDMDVLDAASTVEKVVSEMFPGTFSKVSPNYTNAGYGYDLWTVRENLTNLMHEANLPGLVSKLNETIQNAGLKV